MNIVDQDLQSKRLAQLGELRKYGETPIFEDHFVRVEGKSAKNAHKGWNRNGISFADAERRIEAGKNVAVRIPNGYLVVDIDHRKFDESPEVTKARFFSEFGIDPSKCFAVETGSGGDHLFFKCYADPTTLRHNMVGLGYEGIDIQRAGKAYVVAAGSIHPETGEMYRKTGSVALSSTATAPAKLIEAIRRPQPRTAPGGGTHTPDDIAAMLTGLDVTAWRDHQRWLEIMMACHHASGGLAMQEFIDWSTADSEYEDAGESIEGRWDSFDPNKPGAAVTIKTLYRALHEAGRSELIVEKGEPLETAFDDLEDEEESQPESDGCGIQFINANECGMRPQLPYVVKGLIAQGQSGAIIGEPGVGKSFLAPYLAHCIATGATFFGRKVRPCKVAYYAAEDGYGLELRIKALIESYGPATDFDMLDQSLNLTDKATRKLLRDALVERGTKMLFIDTLAMAFHGLKENDNGAEGMGIVLEAMKYFQDAGIGVVLVHHDSKAGDGVARGGSSLNGGFDWTLPLKRTKDVVSVRGNGKNRRGPPASDISYRIKSVALNLPCGEDGEPITSAVLAPVSGAEADERKHLSGQPAKALELLHKLCVKGGACLIDEFRKAAEELHAISDSDNPKNRRDAASRAAGKLIDLGRVVVDGDLYRLPGHGDEWSEVEAEPNAADLVAAFVIKQGPMSPNKLESGLGEIGLSRAELRDLVERLRGEAQGVETASGILVAETGRKADSIVIKVAEGSDLI